MAKWIFEPGHTAAEFRARHMMVTYVRGHFKNIHGTLEFNPDSPGNSSVAVQIDVRGIWTGVKERDDHLRSADFLDVDHYPEITFAGSQVEIKGEHDFAVAGNLTIRGVTRKTTLNVSYLGQWLTPWWEDGVDKGPRTRAGQRWGLGAQVEMVAPRSITVGATATVSVKTELPTANEGFEHETVPLSPSAGVTHDHPLTSGKETKVVPGGSVSVHEAFAAASGPLLFTVIV